MANNILIIDDEKVFLNSARRALNTSGFKSVTLMNQPEQVPDLLSTSGEFDVAVIDITMPVMDGIDVLTHIKAMSPNTECIMVTAKDEARTAVACLKKGAYDYLVKPIASDDLIKVIGHALERKRLIGIMELTNSGNRIRSSLHPAFHSIITKSPKMLTLMKEAELHANSDIPVLISGETGTGKELLARAVHDASTRAGNPFTPINMASLTDNLFESEFFGHTKGAFTGALYDHTGYFETTDGGTLFLDEIGILQPGLQAKLLRVLQENEFIKLGTNRPRASDVRFVAATNEDLHRLMDSGLFRKDIYYRLRGAQIFIPPLRERKEDIPHLAAHFLKNVRTGNSHPGIGEDALSALMDYDYPGNVRELKAMLQSAVNLSRGNMITRNMLPKTLQARKTCSTSLQKDQIQLSLDELEKTHIRKILLDTSGNLTHTAKILGICLNTLRRKLKLYNLDRK